MAFPSDILGRRVSETHAGSYRESAISAMCAYGRRAARTSTNEFLCSGSVVVSQNAAEAFAALDLTVALTNLFIRLDDRVAKALMISFPMIMFQVRNGSASQRVLTEEDHSR